MINGASLKLVPGTHPALRAVCESVVLDGDGGRGVFGLADARAVAWAMVRLMRRHGGVGLAAPQVGVARRIVVVDADGVDRNSGIRFGEPPRVPLDELCRGVCVLINPEVMGMADETAQDWEGCLTFPGVQRRIARRTGVDVRYVDTLGRYRVAAFIGYAARVVQHELDHLDGRLIVDYPQEPEAAEGAGGGGGRGGGGGGAAMVAALASVFAVQMGPAVRYLGKGRRHEGTKA